MMNTRQKIKQKKVYPVKSDYLTLNPQFHSPEVVPSRNFSCINISEGTSLVVQWLRIHLPMQGTRVRALVQEDPTCHGATNPVHRNY